MLILYKLYMILQSVHAIGLNNHVFSAIPSRTEVAEEVSDETYTSFMCSVRDENKKLICGGSIVSPKWILTAASCINGKSRHELYIMEGSLDIDSGYYYEVEDYILHPEYQRAKPPFNIALIRVCKQIRPFSISKLGDRTINIYPHDVPDTELVEIYGWGRIRYEGPNARRLRMRRSSTISWKECEAIYGEGYIDQNMFCAPAKIGEGICYGDIGGPVVWRPYSIDIPPQLVGIVSFTSPCNRGYPDVLLRLNLFDGWIRNITQMEIQHMGMSQ